MELQTLANRPVGSWGGYAAIGVFGSISTDAYMVLFALAGMLLTAFINNYWQKKRFNAEFSNEQD